MGNLHGILLVFAFVMFVLAAVPYPPSDAYWYRLVSAGLACFIGSMLFG